MNINDSQSLAARCREFLQSPSNGMLATHSVKHTGFPFASVTPFAVDDAARAIFLFSSLATHSKNIRADSRASLLVTPHDPEGPENQWSGARATIVGNVMPLPDEQIETAKEIYLDRYPESKQWLSFGDFSFYCLEPVEIYFVAGFGKMGWIDAGELNPS